jgi:hypothetical protein
MTDPKLDAEREELKSWYKGVLDSVVREMIRAEVITGAAVEAAPVWAVPNRLLIAKVWEVSRKNSFVWAIAGGTGLQITSMGPWRLIPGTQPGTFH